MLVAKVGLTGKGHSANALSLVFGDCYMRVRDCQDHLEEYFRLHLLYASTK